MQTMREELEDLSFRWLHPEAYATVTERLETLRDQEQGAGRGDRQRRSATSSPRSASRPKSQGREKKPYCDLAQDGRTSRSASSSCPTSTRFRVIVDDDRRLLPRARRRAHDLAHGAGPLQGLHLDAEAEQLPVDPHHHRRARATSASSCRSAPRAMHRRRRVRRRRARALQGRAAAPAVNGSAADDAARATRRAAPICGCAAWSRRCSRATTRKSSSSTPSSSCSRIRCSASRPRAA